MKSRHLYHFILLWAAAGGLLSCASTPRQSAPAGGVYSLKLDIPLFPPSTPGYGEFSGDLKDIAMAVSLRLPEGDDSPVGRLLRRLFYEGATAAEYARVLTASQEEAYRAAGAVLLEEPEDRSAGSFAWYYTEDFAVTLADPRYLVLRRDISAYSGGAHPVKTRSWYVIDWENARKLQPEHLLKEGAKDDVKAALLTALNAQGLPEEGFDGEVFTGNFFITPEGLGFQYNPYEIAPYVRGAVEAVLSLGEIEEFLSPEALRTWPRRGPGGRRAPGGRPGR